MRPDDRRQLEKTSLETTSSFFWSSPCTLAWPANPVRLLMPARFTKLAICLQAVAMDEMTIANSESKVPFCSSCKIQKI